MAIPNFQTIMLPLLKLLGQKKTISAREAPHLLASGFRLSDQEQKQLLPSGKQEVFWNRVGWARTFLKKAGLLETPRRGIWHITPKGEEALSQNPEKIDVKFLEQFPEFREWQKISTKNNKEEPYAEKVLFSSNVLITPEEALEATHGNLLANLKEDLLQQVKSCSPFFFESLVIDLLVSMGYGGNRKDAGQAIGRVRDGGIDGIIKEDVLGLDVVYIQAKRWEGTVGRPEIQKFSGALQGYKAKKGVFITTSDFSPDAIEFVRNIESKIVLIDGQNLVHLMIDHNLGVSVKNTYEVKQIDSDYFEEE